MLLSNRSTAYKTDLFPANWSDWKAAFKITPLILGAFDHFKCYCTNTWNSNSTDSCILVLNIPQILSFYCYFCTEMSAFHWGPRICYCICQHNFPSVSQYNWQCSTAHGTSSMTKQSDFISISSHWNPLCSLHQAQPQSSNKTTHSERGIFQYVLHGRILTPNTHQGCWIADLTATWRTPSLYLYFHIFLCVWYF